MTSLTQWAQEVSKWWWAVVVGVILGGESLSVFIHQLHRYILWILVAALAIALTGSLLAYHRLRLVELSETARHTPPGGGVPHIPPVDYQVTALRQIIAKINETMTEVTYSSLQAMLLNHPRIGTDPVYEPLHPFSCEAGLSRLTEQRQIEKLGHWRWKIITAAENRPAHPAKHARAS